MKYKVGLRKDYFPKELWPSEMTMYVDVLQIEAQNPTEAAQKAWKILEPKWQPKMNDWTKHVSLEADDPKTGTVLGRLAPIRVMENQKIPKPQTGSPNLLSPNSYYLYYHQRSGLQDAKKVVPRKISRADRMNRVLEIYRTLAEKIITDLKPQYLHEEDKLRTFEQAMKSHLDNKLRVDPEGKRYLSINGNKFDASDETYEEYFQSGKLPFARVVREIAKELISVVHGNVTEEQDKAVIMGPTAHVTLPQRPETIAVDFDNTLVDQDENPIEGGKEALQALKNKGFQIAIYTARFSMIPPEEWQRMMDYIRGLLTKHQIPYDEISITKPACKFYIDDRGVKFTNWNDVLKNLPLTEDPMGGGPQDSDPKDKKGTPGIGMIEDGDGVQDLKKSKMQQSTIGSSGAIAVQEAVELEHPVDEVKKSTNFHFLTRDEIARKEYEEMNKNEF
jgi:hypothetical protein